MARRALFHGEDSTDRQARDRRVGFVFQHYALFRHSHVLSIGPSVRLELILEDGGQRAPIQAEISKDRFRELKLVQGDSVFIRPRRFELFPNRIH